MTIAELEKALHKMRTTIYNFTDEETEISTFDPRYDSGYEQALHIRFGKNGIRVSMACNIETLNIQAEEEEPIDCKHCEYENYTLSQYPCSQCMYSRVDKFVRKETPANEEEKTI